MGYHYTDLAKNGGSYRSGANGTRKSYQELTFTDDYMFCRVLENDTELCRQLLELILGKEIRKVELVDSQHMITLTSDVHSVRLDVYLNDDAGTVFDLEMQTVSRPEIPQRSRYYQSMIDVDHLGAGMTYDKLPDSYVIFICTFDPFGTGKHRYEFRQLCLEDPSIELDDGSRKIFINATGSREAVSGEMQALLDYLCGQEASSDLTRYIDDSIAQAKHNKRWERDYMLFEEKLREERAEGRVEGLAEGKTKERSEILKVIRYLYSINRSEDIESAVSDPEFRKSILDQMGA